MAPSQPQRKQRVRRAVPTIDDSGELAPSCDSQLTVAIQKNGMEKSSSTLFLQTSFKRRCCRITSIPFRNGKTLIRIIRKSPQ